MQKPQQRKYHSSCNRSVHRGTAHGKQEVKVCKRKTPHLFLMRSFLSPYGDGTADLSEVTGATMFSPPLRGWYHLPASGTAERLVFAPLRGLYRTNFCKSKVQSVFAPLWGWYCLPEYTSALRFSFRPLTGMVPYRSTNSTTISRFRPLTGMVRVWRLRFIRSWSFRPLTGMVHGDDWYFLADAGFRPLMGMVPATINQLRQAIRFSSPCGDKLKFRKNGFTLDHVRFPSPCGAAPLYHGGGTIEIPFQGEP